MPAGATTYTWNKYTWPKSYTNAPIVTFPTSPSQPNPVASPAATYPVNGNLSVSGSATLGATTASTLSVSGASTLTGLVSAQGGVKVGNGAALAATLWSGSGVPSAGLGANGDFYFRSDVPGTANQRLYIKSAGAWTALTL